MAKLTLQQANQIIEGALAKAREMKIKPLGVVVLDESGHLKAAQREDSASMFRTQVATGKAWAAVAMGASSRALAARAKDNPNFFVTLAATAEGKFLPQTGAVLIRDSSGELLGAAGASGGTGDEDEAACIYGIEQAGLVAEV
ncbi:MAG: GlcG/HbpS family heme-binding protein [Burkholderiales bacterium]